jgi:hypothetical protein
VLKALIVVPRVKQVRNVPILLLQHYVMLVTIVNFTQSPVTHVQQDTTAHQDKDHVLFALQVKIAPVLLELHQIVLQACIVRRVIMDALTVYQVIIALLEVQTVLYVQLAKIVLFQI